MLPLDAALPAHVNLPSFKSVDFAGDFSITSLGSHSLRDSMQSMLAAPTRINQKPLTLIGQDFAVLVLKDL
jgi:hypothetical protein